AEPFTMSMPAVSKHLRVLEYAGLISRTKSAQWRRCRLRPEGFQAAMSWLRDYETFWTESFDRLAEHLANSDDIQDRPEISKGGDPDGDG
ncbi:MAG: ArsR/SmtB family transcription factor, partial [Geminicoccaceae bacterium]